MKDAGDQMSVMQPGDAAPDFTLPGVPPGEYRLADQRGRPVVLVFYPGDFTPVCTTQLSHYQENWDTFARTGAVLWAVSVDDLERHERFAKARSLGFPLLADTTGEVSRQFDALGELGTSNRVVVVLDAQGRLVWRREEPFGLTFAEMDEIVAHLGALGLAADPARSA